MKLQDVIRGVALGSWDMLRDVLTFAMAIVADVLPRRLWPRLNDTLPMWRAATASGIFTIFVAFAVGIPGYFNYVRGNSARTVALLLQSTGWMPLRRSVEYVLPPLSTAARLAAQGSGGGT
jgi:hypothetical protein